MHTSSGWVQTYPSRQGDASSHPGRQYGYPPSTTQPDVSGHHALPQKAAQVPAGQPADSGRQTPVSHAKSLRQGAPNAATSAISSAQRPSSPHA